MSVRVVCFCGECGKAAEQVTGDIIYPHRPDLASLIFYLCGCGAYCGSHRDTLQPLGKPANFRTRQARSRAHRAFDFIWRGKIMDRNAAYAWLADKLGVTRFECHIGSFDAPTCDRVTRIAEEFINALSPAEIEAAKTLKAESGRTAGYRGNKPHSKRRNKKLSRMREEASNRASRYRLR